MRGKQVDRTIVDEITVEVPIDYDPMGHRRPIARVESMLEEAVATMHATGNADSLRLFVNPEESAQAAIAPQLDAYLDAHPDPRIIRRGH